MPARILAVGSAAWTSKPLTRHALNQVAEVYQAPFTLVCDMSDGAARYAAATARELGWTVEPHDVDTTKCGPDCPTTNHRRRGGPEGDYCPTARARNTDAMVAADIHLVVAFTRPGNLRDTGTRSGQFEARRRDIGIWTFEQKASK